MASRERFDRLLAPHLGAAYNLARWLLRNDQDAEDAVQEAALRAFRFSDAMTGTGARTWLLSIVRNACFTALGRARARPASEEFDEERHPGNGADPEMQVVRNAERKMIDEELERLPPEFREVVVLRELEGLSYKEIAGVAGIPLGTVMSRLSRARRQLQKQLAARERSGP